MNLEDAFSLSMDVFWANRKGTTDQTFEYLLNSKALADLPYELRSYHYQHKTRMGESTISFGEWLLREYPETFHRHLRWYVEHGELNY